MVCYLIFLLAEVRKIRGEGWERPKRIQFAHHADHGDFDSCQITGGT